MLLILKKQQKLFVVLQDQWVLRLKNNYEKTSKRYKEILKTSIKDKKVSAKEALDLVKKNSNVKFDESIDVSLKINLKQSKGGDFSLRTIVNLPNGSGKKIK